MRFSSPRFVLNSLVSLSLFFLAVAPASVGAAASAPSPHRAPAFLGAAMVPPSPALSSRLGASQVAALDRQLHSGLTAKRSTPADAMASAGLPRPSVPTTGTVPRLLVLLVDFSDQAGTQSESGFDQMLFGSWPSGSLHDYYAQNSWGRLNLQGDIVGMSNGAPVLNTGGAVYIRVPHPMSYYSANNYGFGAYPTNSQGLVGDALTALNGAGFNFAPYADPSTGLLDNLIVIHAGQGADVTGASADLWSVHWGLNSPMTLRGATAEMFSLGPELGLTATARSTIGVFCHEFGHNLGLPDLYDTNGASSGDGDWTLMAAGEWNGPDQVGPSGYYYPNGARPADLDPFSKIFLGWATPTVVTSMPTLTQIPAVENSPTIYQLNPNGVAGSEYDLVENRTNAGFDSNLAGYGLLIWHVDTTIMNPQSVYWAQNDTVNALPGSAGAPPHQGLVVMEADGAQGMLAANGDDGNAGDPFPGSANNQLYAGASTPSSNLWSGSGSSIVVAAISAAGGTMTAQLGDEVSNNLTATPPSTPVATPAPTTTAIPSSGGPTSSSTYWFTWYDDKSPSIEGNWILLGNPSTTTSASVTVAIAGRQVGVYTLQPGQEATPTFPGVRGGPVEVTSTSQLITSQRVLLNGSFNEILGTPASNLTSDVWFTWYDHQSASIQGNWILVANPTNQSEDVSITVAGRFVGGGALAPGAEMTPSFPGLKGGPVHVTANGPILASQRVVLDQTFSEIMGVPSASLSQDTWFTWYDHSATTISGNWVLVANPQTTPTIVDIYVGDVLKDSATLAPGAIMTPQFQGQKGGPVRIVSTQPIIASQRIVYLNSFHETQGRPEDLLATDNWFPWYDYRSASVQGNWVLLANPTTATSAVSASIKIAGRTVGQYYLQPGQEAVPQFPGVMGGPVHVAANGQLIVSQRVVLNHTFSEIIGQPVE